MKTYKKSHRSVFLLAALTAILATGGTAQAAFLIDFEGQPVGAYGGGTVTITAGGIDVTFSGPGLQIRQFSAPFPNTKVLSTDVDAGPITVTFGGSFTADWVEFENIINGRFTAEVDSPTGTAYDIFNTVLDTTTNSNTIHHLSGPGIAKAVYVEGSLDEGFLMDNFEFVPEPATVALMAFGLAGVVATRRKRRGA